MAQEVSEINKKVDIKIGKIEKMLEVLTEKKFEKLRDLT
jgi:hypothetical protein